MLKNYYELAKPGIIYGNIVTLTGGFFVGSRAGGAGGVNIFLMAVTLIGLSLVIACGGTLNNIFDRDIDAKMARTGERVMVRGKITMRSAIICAASLGVSGFAVLTIFTNLLAVAVAVAGALVYVAVYTLWAKRHTVHGALIGSISGAVPPVVGYAAANGKFDLGAAILGLMLILWQMPHFYAIAIRRRDDYAAAKIPVLPVVYGVRMAKIAIMWYVVGFIIAAVALFAFGYAGFAYAIVAEIAGLIWLGFCARGFWISGDAENKRWARQIFLVSLIVLTATFAAMIIGK